MSDEDERYTLRDARWELARQECMAHGHDWNVIHRGFIPVSIICERCGDSYKIAPRDE